MDSSAGNIQHQFSANIRERISSTLRGRNSLRKLAMLDFAIDNMAESLYLIDSDARFVHVNHRACCMLGYAADELMCLTVLDIDPDFTPNRWREHWTQTMNERGGIVVTRHRTKAGAVLMVEVRVSRLVLGSSNFILALVTDISERRQTEQVIRACVDNSSDAVIRYDREGRRTYANQAFLDLSGMTLDECICKRPLDFMPSPNVQTYMEVLFAVLSDGVSRRLEHTWLGRDGNEIVSEFCLMPEFDAQGSIVSVVSIGRDITALREKEWLLREAETMARLGHWRWRRGRSEVKVSLGVGMIFGAPDDWAPGRKELFSKIIQEDRGKVLTLLAEAYARGDAEVEMAFRGRRGKDLLYLHVRARVEFDQTGTLIGMVGTIQDVSPLKDYEDRLHELTFYDELTHLPNRALFNDRLRQALGDAQRNNTALGLMIVDLDRFKEVNDNHGYVVGDGLLRKTAQRLERLVRSEDTVARIGGDEFAIVLPRMRDAQDVGVIANKVLESLSRPVLIDGHEWFNSASVGISVYPGDGRTPNELLQYADTALHDAKTRGRASYRFYSAELTAKSQYRLDLETRLRRADLEKEMQIHFQPKFDMVSGCLVGAEALLRWQHPVRGILGPNEFIQIAEDSGLICGVGMMVLNKACRAARDWNQDRGCELKVAINLSPRQFHGGNLLASVCNALVATRCKPRWLEFEITESLLLEDSGAVRSELDAFRRLGISIAIDDFGTGYSSLGYLKRFPIDVLKVDRSFVNDVNLNRDSAELTKAIISMAQSLGLEIVAEGVETEAQENFLVAHGCRLGQGYRFGKPVAQSEFEKRFLPMTRTRMNG